MTSNACALVVAAMVSAVLGACGNTAPGPSGASTGGAVVAPTSESNPAGDIPDSQAFVSFASPDGLFTVSVPEGWARTTDGTATVFSDKLNTVRIDARNQATPPSVVSVTADDVPGIESTTAGYRPGAIRVVDRTAGQAVLITYQATSAPSPVTGKSGTDAIERYEFWRDGREVVLTLSSPVGADNVDPWRTITDSLQWR